MTLQRAVNEALTAAPFVEIDGVWVPVSDSRPALDHAAAEGLPMPRENVVQVPCDWLPNRLRSMLGGGSA